MSNRVMIGAAQMGPSSFIGKNVDKKDNVRRILALLEKAIKRNVKIVCLPELALTDYFPVRMDPNFEQYCDQIPNDQTKVIFSFTREHPISVILPYAEFDGIAFYNTAGVIHKGQLLGKYRKIHIPGALVDQEGGVIISSEKQYFTPGNLGYPVFDLYGVKVGIQICYDRAFPEGYRALALNGAQLVFNPTNVGYRRYEWRKTLWKTFLTVRSFENNLFVVGVNKGGVENGV
jgi:beta-ureidopropionase